MYPLQPLAQNALIHRDMSQEPLVTDFVKNTRGYRLLTAIGVMLFREDRKALFRWHRLEHGVSETRRSLGLRAFPLGVEDSRYRACIARSRMVGIPHSTLHLYPSRLWNR